MNVITLGLQSHSTDNSEESFDVGVSPRCLKRDESHRRGHYHILICHNFSFSFPIVPLELPSVLLSYVCLGAHKEICQSS